MFCLARSMFLQIGLWFTSGIDEDEPHVCQRVDLCVADSIFIYIYIFIFINFFTYVYVIL